MSGMTVDQWLRDYRGMAFGSAKAKVPDVAWIESVWIPALRSGKYEQATGVLRKGNSYCCLGVACDLRGLEWRIMFGSDQYVVELDAKGLDRQVESVELPSRLAEDLGMGSSAIDLPPYDAAETIGLDPRYVLEDSTSVLLANLNDDGLDFPAIADVLAKVCERWRQFAAEAIVTNPVARP